MNKITTSCFDDTNIEYHENDVVIYSQVFNDLLGLKEVQWACFEIKKGDGANGASFPPIASFLLWLHNRDYRIRWAYFGHDKLFQMAGLEIEFFLFDRQTNTKGERIGSYLVSNRLSNAFFIDKCKVGLYRKFLMATGLFIGSWVSFNKYKRKNAV